MQIDNGIFELALRGQDEMKETLKKEVFWRSIDFSSELDRDLKEDFNKASIFKATSKTIQHVLFKRMPTVYNEEVEWKKCDYVAVVADKILMC